MQRDETSMEEREGAGGFSLDRAWFAVRRRWKIVAILPVVAGMLAAVAVSFMTTRYDASAIVQIDPRKKSISNLEAIVSDLKADSTTVESEVEVLRSRPIAVEVIDRLDLRSDPEFTEPSAFGKLLSVIGFSSKQTATSPGARTAKRDSIADLISAEHPGTSSPETDAVAVAFASRLKVIRVRNTLLIDVRYSANDAVKAAKIANTIAEVYLNNQLEEKKNASSFATKVLEHKLGEMRKQVADAEHKVEQHKAEYQIFDTEGHILSEKNLARAMEQIVLARNTTAEARAKFEQAERQAKAGQNSGINTAVLQSDTVRLMKEQFATLTRRQAELQTRYGARHPEMLKVAAEVREAQAQLETEISRLVQNLKNEYGIAAGRERDLEASLQNMKSQQLVTNDANVRLKELERDATTSKQLYEALIARYKQTAETESLQLPDARIVEQADAPLFPASPKRKQIVLIALLAGLAAGLAIAVALEFLTPGLGRPEDAEALLAVPHISSLPRIVEEDAPPLDPLAAIRLVIADPGGDYAEAIRSCRREIDINWPNQPSRVIMVASALPGEGSGITASNLAHHYALTGNRVLLVDADMRRAPLSRQLAPEAQFGLAECLAHRQPLVSAILTDGATGLNFLPARGRQPTVLAAAEALSSPDFAYGLSELRAEFDTIIIDTPPILPVVDARIIADHADQILFVMGWRKTPKQLAKKAVRSLGFNRERIAGVIVNEVDPGLLREQRGFGIELPIIGRRKHREFTYENAA